MKPISKSVDQCDISDGIALGWYPCTGYETGSAEIDLYFESVTNVVPVTAGQSFIKLEVEGDF